MVVDEEEVLEEVEVDVEVEVLVDVDVEVLVEVDVDEDEVELELLVLEDVEVDELVVVHVNVTSIAESNSAIISLSVFGESNLHRRFTCASLSDHSTIQRNVVGQRKHPKCTSRHNNR